MTDTMPRAAGAPRSHDPAPGVAGKALVVFVPEDLALPGVIRHVGTVTLAEGDAPAGTTPEELRTLLADLLARHMAHGPSDMRRPDGSWQAAQ